MMPSHRAAAEHRQEMWLPIPEASAEPERNAARPAHGALVAADRGPPEHELALAVLCQAMNDLVRYRCSRSRANQRLSWEAYEWERPKTARGRSAP